MRSITLPSAWLMLGVASVFSCPVNVDVCYSETSGAVSPCISIQQAVLQVAVVCTFAYTFGNVFPGTTSFCLVVCCWLCVGVGCVGCMLHSFARSKHALSLCSFWMYHVQTDV